MNLPRLTRITAIIGVNRYNVLKESRLERTSGDTWDLCIVLAKKLLLKT